MTKRAWMRLARGAVYAANRSDGREAKALAAHEIAMNRWNSKPMSLLRVLQYFDWLSTDEWIRAAGGPEYQCGRVEYNAWEQAIVRLRKAGLVDFRRPARWKFQHRANDRTYAEVNAALAATRVYHERAKHQFSDDKQTRRAA